jgi:hypothetical protein
VTLDRYEVYSGPMLSPAASMARWVRSRGRDSIDLLADTDESLRRLFRRFGDLGTRQVRRTQTAGIGWREWSTVGRVILRTSKHRLDALDDVATVLARLGRVESAEEAWRSTDGVRSFLLWIDAATGVTTTDASRAESLRDAVDYLEERWGDEVRADPCLADRLAGELGAERSSLTRARRLQASSSVALDGRVRRYRRLPGVALVGDGLDRRRLRRISSEVLEADPSTRTPEEAPTPPPPLVSRPSLTPTMGWTARSLTPAPSEVTVPAWPGSVPVPPGPARRQVAAAVRARRHAATARPR